MNANLTLVKKNIELACRHYGRDSSTVRLLAVSKTQPSTKIRELILSGQSEFGESYAQEMITKARELSYALVRWVFVGPLQSNKIARIVEIASEIQSLSSEKHVRYVARYAKEFGKTPYPVFLEVNAGNEEQKHGFPQDEVGGVARTISDEFPELDLRGIMAVPPFTYQDQTSGDTVPQLYLQLRQLAEGIGKGELSLGMSGDMKIAIAAGSTCVRIGTALFGPRN